MKKVLSIVLSLVLVICMMPVMAFAAYHLMRLIPTSAGEKCEGAVNVLDALGVVDGYEDGTYRPGSDSYESRNGKIDHHSSGMERTMRLLRSPAIPIWRLHSGRSHMLNTLQICNIVEGVGGGRFSPGNPVTYEQAATMIVRALGFHRLSATK